METERYYATNIRVVDLKDVSREQASNLITAGNAERYIFEDQFNGIVELSYPLTSPAKIEVSEVSTVGDLLWDLSNAYRKIYEEEKLTSNISDNIEESNNILNRPKTDGKYGIWGHVIDDLIFEGVNISERGINIVVGS